MSSILSSMDRLHARVRANPFLYRFALGTRMLLAMGFIPTGMVKLMGHRFTAIGTDTEVGRFFEALYQGGGLYWHFLGAVQVTAGVLILFPATATLGAIIFFPFILNIFVITLSYHFKGTPFVTGPMVLASHFLLCWDYDRLRPVLFPGRYGEGQTTPLPARVVSLGSRWEVATYWIGGIAGFCIFAAIRGQVPFAFVRVGLGVGMVAAIAALVGSILAMRRQRRPSREPLPI
jgi:hypothetical protein